MPETDPADSAGNISDLNLRIAFFFNFGCDVDYPHRDQIRAKPTD